jgi:ribulose-phosphate 3-epimerase
MCSKFTDLEQYITLLNQTDLDFFHIDIADGVLAPNFCFTPFEVRTIRELTDKPLDFHFMVHHPNTVIPWYEVRAGDRISVHIEAEDDLKSSLQLIHEKSAQAFIALKSETTITQLSTYLTLFDGIVIMSVNLGFAGSSFNDGSFAKVETARKYLDAEGLKSCSIECDGAITLSNAQKLKLLGASDFVLGTSSIFNGHVEDVVNLYQQFRNQIDS